MIDPLRPYWPTNRSIAGLLARSFCLVVAAAATQFSASRSFGLLLVFLAGLAQASVLVFEWMELKRTSRSGLFAVAITALLFFSLVVALVLEARSVLVLSVR
jgi:hypothetical protein